MGEVWLATARGPGGFQKRLVIKTVLPDLMEKPGYVQMLVREASLAARLDHPNIVHVFDLGCVGSLYFIAMEYLSGRSLAQMLRRSHDRGQRLPLRVLLTMIASCCDGLQYAHDYNDEDGQKLGLLHRDISPSNVMLTFAGRVALLDFGVATATHGQHRTKSGTIKGKFHYLAPERVRGETADHRSDIYSLGVVLYQCLTLRWPFRAQNEYELLRQIAHDAPPPVRHYAPWVTGRLERIIMRAMANEASARHQQARDLATDLRDYLRSIGAVVESSELTNCLAGLFPEAPEAMARQLVPPPAGDLDDGIEIIFQSSEAHEPGEACDAGSAHEPGQTRETREALDLPPSPEPGPVPEAAADRPVRASTAPGDPSEASESTELDQPDPVVVGAGSPIFGPPSRPRREPTWTAAAVPPVAPGETRPHIADDSDVDIFPEPTRSLPPLGADVFAGYGRRGGDGPGQPAPGEPAFFGATAGDPAPDTSSWPWARTLERVESPPDAAPHSEEREEAS
jgi:eukaryotic-like serine/threonine-protein kinase